MLYNVLSENIAEQRQSTLFVKSSKNIDRQYSSCGHGFLRDVLSPPSSPHLASSIWPYFCTHDWPGAGVQLLGDFSMLSRDILRKAPQYFQVIFCWVRKLSS